MDPVLVSASIESVKENGDIIIVSYLGNTHTIPKHVAKIKNGRLLGYADDKDSDDTSYVQFDFRVKPGSLDSRHSYWMKNAVLQYEEKTDTDIISMLRSYEKHCNHAVYMKLYSDGSGRVEDGDENTLISFDNLEEFAASVNQVVSPLKNAKRIAEQACKEAGISLEDFKRFLAEPS
jgi:hypothetical protein